MNDVTTTIEPDQCGNCRFRYTGGMPLPLLRCRRFPPITVSVLEPNPEPDPKKRPEHQTGEWIVMERSSFAIVAVMEWCGEHVKGDPLGPQPLPSLPPELVAAANPPRKRRHRRVLAPI